MSLFYDGRQYCFILQIAPPSTYPDCDVCKDDAISSHYNSSSLMPQAVAAGEVQDETVKIGDATKITDPNNILLSTSSQEE